MLFSVDCAAIISSLQLAYWISVILSTIAAVVVPEIRNWHRYGKLREGTERASWLDSFTVSKRWFILFYAFGLAWSFALLLTRSLIAEMTLEWLRICREPVKDFSSFHPIPMIVFVIHLVRRFVEEFISPPSDARMHFSAFLVGVSFYGFIPLALVDTKNADGDNDDVGYRSLSLGLALFFWGSYHQWKCHQILRKLRQRSSVYGFPHGDWFTYSSSPHYFAEMVIYLGLAFVSTAFQSLPTPYVLGMVFTVLNLSVTGARTHDWYLQKFGVDYAKESRWKVIPFVF